MKKNQNKANEKYLKLVEELSPSPPLVKNCLKAFVAGGFICTIGQAITNFLGTIENFPQENIPSATSIILIFIAIILTGLGWYDKFAQWAGAGSAVPITGFGNCMASAAIEYKSEGIVLGVGGNMFKVCGPVIVFGSVAAFLAALIRYLVVIL